MINEVSADEGRVPTALSFARIHDFTIGVGPLVAHQNGDPCRPDPWITDFNALRYRNRYPVDIQYALRASRHAGGKTHIFVTDVLLRRREGGRRTTTLATRWRVRL